MRQTTLLVLLTACGASAPPRVHVGAPWPDKASDYAAAHRAWTRHDGHSADWTRVIDVYATLESAEFRAAYAHERAQRLKLGAQAEADLIAAQRAAADGPIEVVLVVMTAQPNWNDLDKLKDSIWRVTLADAEGHEVEPTKTIKDRRPRAEIASWFSDFQPFYTAYTATFPRTTADGKNLLESKQLTLKIAGGMGTVEMIWSE